MLAPKRGWPHVRVRYLPTTQGCIMDFENDISRILDLGNWAFLNSHLEGALENNRLHCLGVGSVNRDVRNS